MKLFAKLRAALFKETDDSFVESRRRFLKGAAGLAAFGWSSQEIARRLGYASAQYVDGLLALAGAPLAIRKMVMENVIAATTAIEAIKKHGDKAVDVLLADPGFQYLARDLQTDLVELLGSLKATGAE